ncbi:hypothetical protein [Mitsuaria sp. GD03876]|uniref:hypothetical protein n=1 Tax=Mitsuaria sp. GD03876 TaxID=2975399 RepID=UPI00244A202B|nr:hypothetical protein [Mitsuaria sp. GD03876]MDH0863124.1 hypothetical protein [Mitsuaria sp. GD03876]
MDEITRKWFDASTVQVRRAPELHGWYSDEELIRLSGAPIGSRLDVEPSPDGAIDLRVVNQDLLCEPLVRRISQDESGDYVFEIHNAAFVLRPQFRRQGIGTRSVAIELHEALRLGHFSKVTTSAVGDWSSRSGPLAMVGYFAWARMGFNARLPADVRQHNELPASCRMCEDLISLLASREGEAFWLRHGHSLDMEFHVVEPSSSWEHFRRYAGPEH